ncbi:MAG: T9SS type A sorting domain-containing protein, partial [Saprospiraceae bacterium]|nr:T9SS type A sorting domain-containing protein [Saprospiraceae bacterium]
YTDPINSSGGFIRHHEQWDEFVATQHYEVGFTCTSCHDPHKRSIWGGAEQGGITRECESCHAEEASMLQHTPGLSCIDCHMPFAAKSGTTRGESGFKGDVRSHLMLITTDTASMFTDDGSAVRDDEMRKASLSPAFACLGCHNDDPNDEIPDKTLEAAVLGAMGIHEVSTSVTGSAFEVFNLNIYPNPARDHVTIGYRVSRPMEIIISIRDVSGRLIYNVNRIHSITDQATIQWNGHDLDGLPIEPGMYFVTLVSGNDRSVGKLIVIE